MSTINVTGFKDAQQTLSLPDLKQALTTKARRSWIVFW